jgi:lysozyme
MVWLKLTSEALYLMDGEEYLDKADLILNRASPEQYILNLPLVWLQGEDTPGWIIVSLKSTLQPNKKALPPPASETTRRQIRITKTGVSRPDGLAVLEVALMEGSRKVDSVSAVSGVADHQAFRLASKSKAGSKEPLPEGVWDLGIPKPDEMTKARAGISKLVEFASGIPGDFGTDWPQDGDGLGPVWIEMTCRSQTSRSTIGFHVDNNSTSAPGTVGCVGIVNDAGLKSLKKFASWFDNSTLAPHFAIVDWGLGSV